MANESRAPKPDNFPWLSPYLTVKDVDAALSFYEKAFGFTKAMAMPDETGQSAHGQITYQDGVVMVGREGAYGDKAKAPVNTGVTTPVSLYIYCEDVDHLFERAKAAGATVMGEPEDMFWGDRVCRFEDPDGHRWTFATNKFDFNPEEPR